MSLLPGLNFGSGIILASPQSTSGNPAPNPTPLTVGVIQNVKVTFGADIKTLFGQNQWPVDSAVGKRTIKGSFEFAQLTNELFAQLFTGDTTTAGVIYAANNGNGEAGTIPSPSGPYTITVSNSAHFVADFGVTFTLTGVPLTRVASGPTTGQYSVVVATGVYTFAAADDALGVLINYTYSSTTGGTTITAANHTMGYGPILALQVVFPYEGLPSPMGFNFPNVRLGKIDGTTKIDDYTMWSTDFEAFAGSGGVPFSAFNTY